MRDAGSGPVSASSGNSRTLNSDVLNSPSVLTPEGRINRSTKAMARGIVSPGGFRFCIYNILLFKIHVSIHKLNGKQDYVIIN